MFKWNHGGTDKTWNPKWREFINRCRHFGWWSFETFNTPFEMKHY